MGTTPSKMNFTPMGGIPGVRPTAPEVTDPMGGGATSSPMNRPYAGGFGGGLANRPAMPMWTPPKPADPMGPPAIQGAGLPMWTPPKPTEPMRSPMAAKPSAANHSYGGGLAGREKVQKGRSGYDLNRIAEQHFRQTKDPSLLMAMDWRNRMGPQAPGPGLPPMMSPAAPNQPSGHFQPGRSAGSQVWVPNAPIPGVDGTPMDAGYKPPELQDPMSPRRQQQQPPPQEQEPFSFPVPMLPWDGKGPLPPSTLGGGTGVPAGPRFQAQDVVGSDGKSRGFVGVDSTTGKLAGLSGANAAQLPSAEMMQGFDKMGLKPSGANSQGQMQFAPPKSAKTVAPTVKEFKGKDGVSVEYRQYNPETGNWHKVKFADEDGDGVPDAQQQQQQGGGAAAPAGNFTSPGGVKYQVKPQAGVQTGQMPNEAYANDLTPQQSLAAAHDEYLRTGEDTALRKHFSDFPSAQVQEIQRGLEQNQQSYDEQQRAGEMPPPARPQTQAERNPGGIADRLGKWTPPDWLPRFRGDLGKAGQPAPTQAERNPEGIVARMNRKR